MSQEQTTISASGRALSDTLGDIIAKAEKIPGQAPASNQPPSQPEAGTSQVTDGPPPAEATETLTETPPAEEAPEAGTAPKQKIKILPTDFYEVEVGGQIRELDGKSLLGEMMLKSDFSRQQNELKKTEEEAKAKLDEAAKIAHWVNLAANDKFAAPYLQALNAGHAPEKAYEYATSVSGIKPEPKAPDAIDPRSTILDNIDADDPTFAEKTRIYTEYKAEEAEKKAYARIKAELDAERLQATESAKREAAAREEERQRTESIVAYNKAALDSADKFLEARFGQDFSSLSDESKKPLYEKIRVYLRDEEGIDTKSTEYMTTNLVHERDIKLAVAMAFDRNFSLKPQSSQPPPPPQPSGSLQPQAKLPFSATGQSHGLPPVEDRSNESSNEQLHRTLNSILAKAK